jgi:pimeloyl-ACP methyl ester carboxylesterase
VATSYVTSGDTRLAVTTAGPWHGPPTEGDGAASTAGPRARGPQQRQRAEPVIVLLHGWAQSAHAWRELMSGPLAERYRLAAPDLRGHGGSDAPRGGYADPGAWAGDLAAVLARLDAPAALVGWSYAGLVVADYLRVYGDEQLAGIVLVGAITEIGKGRAGGRTGPVMRAALPDALSADPGVAEPALAGFVDGMTAQPLPATRRAEFLGAALATPARVRAALFDRVVDSGEVLAGTRVPALVLHGSSDEVVSPEAGRYAADRLPNARQVTMNTGHAPFVERPEECGHHVAEFLSGGVGQPQGPR